MDALLFPDRMCNTPIFRMRNTTKSILPLIGVLLETTFRWRHPYFHSRPNIFVGDPQILMGDPQTFDGNPQIFVGDPFILIGDPQIRNFI